MTDTLELLETIGRDASLRHASSEVLGRVLDEAGASESLRAAVATGDGSKLDDEFRDNERYMGQAEPPQGTQFPGDDDEDTDDEDDKDDESTGAPDRAKTPDRSK